MFSVTGLQSGNAALGKPFAAPGDVHRVPPRTLFVTEKLATRVDRILLGQRRPEGECGVQGRRLALHGSKVLLDVRSLGHR